MRDDSPASDDLDRPDVGPDLGLFDEDDDLAGGMANFIDDDMGDFIEDEDESDEDGENRRLGGSQARRRPGAGRKGAPARRGGFGIGHAIASGGLKGFSAEMWEEINEIFGNSEDYAWAMDEPDSLTAHKKIDMADVRISRC